MVTLAADNWLGQELSSIVPEGSPLEAYLHWSSQAHASPTEYHLAVMLSIAAHELARRGFQVEDNEYPLQIWTALVGNSASGKSKAINMAEDFLRDLWELSGSTPKNDPWLNATGSVSGIFAALQDFHDQNRGSTVALLVEQEFSSILQQRDAVTEFLCSLYEGRTLQRNLKELQKATRSSQGKVQFDKIKKPAISTIFASTEEALGSCVTPSMVHGGLFSRLWWVSPEKLTQKYVRRQNFDAFREKALTAWSGWYVQLGLLETKTLTFSDEALAILETYYANLVTKYAETSDEVPSGRTRAFDRARVLAVIFATFDGRSVASANDMHCALAAADHSYKALAKVSMLGSSETVQAAHKALRLLARSPTGLTRRDLYRKTHMDKRQLEWALELLQDAQDVLEDRSGRDVKYVAANSERGKELGMSQIRGGILRLVARETEESEDSEKKHN